MKFIHTADWHIGRKLQGVDLLLDQQFVLENLIADIKKDNIDFIIIAGDLYDRSVPSKEATILAKKRQKIKKKTWIEKNIYKFFIYFFYVF